VSVVVPNLPTPRPPTGFGLYFVAMQLGLRYADQKLMQIYVDFYISVTVGMILIDDAAGKAAASMEAFSKVLGDIDTEERALFAAIIDGENSEPTSDEAPDV
jgi:hypothetical protein